MAPLIPPTFRESRWWSYWLPVLVWAGLIFYFSSIPHLRITESPWDLVLRKIAHMVVFGVLALLLSRALAGTRRWNARRVYLFALFGTILYAFSDELHQHFVTGRTASLMDVGFDSLGTWIALRLKK